MIYYLNMGFILEHALVDVVKRYFDRQRFDEVYGNFHISVVNEHPFAHMIIDENARASDCFPSVVITTQSDSKPSELMNVPAQVKGLGLTSEDIDNIVNSTTRVKTRINDKGEIEVVKKKGEPVIERIPGYVLVIDEETINKLKTIADSRELKMIYGIKVETRRTDHVSIEIWAENNQLKNEIYEHLRIMLASTINDILCETYQAFDPSVFDGTIHGERSSNYNFDFDVMLCGSHIALDVDYAVSQIIIDTEIETIDKDLIVEVINHVKE